MTASVSTTCSEASALFKNELRGNAVAYAWLETELRRLTEAATAAVGSGLGTAYATAGRKFDALPLPLAAETRARLDAFGLVQPSWTPKQAARASLLLGFAAVAPAPELERQVRDLFYKGDSDERVVVLRCLPLVPEASQYDLVATDAVRSHVQSVFEAIACENPFPARHFTDPAFNQLVMKTYFTGAAAHRIVGLAQRRNQELTRMALDFAAERRAASRPVPVDLDLVTS